MTTEQPSDNSASSRKADTLTAVCHCGRVRIQLPSKPTRLLECHCTVCYKYGALWAYFPRNEPVIKIADDATLVPYIREDTAGNISFNRCSYCGCMVCWLGEKGFSGPTHKMGVNCRMLTESEIEGIEKKVSKGPGN